MIALSAEEKHMQKELKAFLRCKTRSVSPDSQLSYVVRELLITQLCTYLHG